MQRNCRHLQKLTIDMSNLFNIGFIDAENITGFWPKVEPHLLPIGIRVFISMLESRCEKIPACKKACCSKDRYRNYLQYMK